MTQVRDMLKELAERLRRVHQIVEDKALASHEVRDRLEMATVDMLKIAGAKRPCAATQSDAGDASEALALESRLVVADVLPVLSPLLRRLSEAAELAFRAVPSEQRRTRDADPLPIARIERALSQGFIDHHSKPPRRPPFPPYELRTSVKKSPFPEIAAIVYEAAGRQTEHASREGRIPERAIRAYIRLKKQSRKRKHGSITVVTLDAPLETDPLLTSKSEPMDGRSENQDLLSTTS